jgi:hypothetical protein
MPQSYWKAGDDVIEIADRYLPLHTDLVGAHVAFICKEKASKRDGQPIVAKAKKVPTYYKCLMEEQDDGEKGYDFIIEIGADAWAELSDTQREAWIDHALEHCYGEENKSGDLVWKIRKPEISTFGIVLSRHGTRWDTGVNKLSVIQLNEQPTLQEPKVRQNVEQQEDSIQDTYNS